MENEVRTEAVSKLAQSYEGLCGASIAACRRKLGTVTINASFNARIRFGLFSAPRRDAVTVIRNTFSGRPVAGSGQMLAPPAA